MSLSRNAVHAPPCPPVLAPIGVLELLAPVAEELGPELFQLLLRHGSASQTREAVDASVASGVAGGWCAQVGLAGWGRLRMEELDCNQQRARIVVEDPFELRTRQLDAASQCPLLAAIVGRGFTNLFGREVEVVSTEVVVAARSVTFVVAPSASCGCERLASLRQASREATVSASEATAEWRASEARTRELLRQRTRALRDEIVAREQAERAKDDMLATVSHELRTPLTSLRGFTELMRDRDLPPDKQRRCVEIIHNESLRLSHLIDDFLDLQSMERGKDNTAMQPEDMGPVLASAAELYSTGSHRVRLVVPSAVPPVMIDVRRVQQVLNNLLSNAIKFSAGKDVVDLSLDVREDDVIVHVRDHGIGIPPDAVSKLFTKFYRVDNADTRAIGGTGLGLAITKQIVERHGGAIWVESVVGQGTTFSFTLIRAPRS